MKEKEQAGTGKDIVQNTMTALHEQEPDSKNDRVKTMGIRETFYNFVTGNLDKVDAESLCRYLDMLHIDRTDVNAMRAFACLDQPPPLTSNKTPSEFAPSFNSNEKMVVLVKEPTVNAKTSKHPLIKTDGHLVTRGEHAIGPQGAVLPNVAVAGRQLCQFFMHGPSKCRYVDKCRYVHGWLCPYCNLNCLHPRCPAQVAEHLDACLLGSKQNNEDEDTKQPISHPKSKADDCRKVCGICLEVVQEKTEDSRFGLLQCQHVFCYPCIMAWRKNGGKPVPSPTSGWDAFLEPSKEQYRKCPCCRETTHFVTPSFEWPESAEKKDALINAHRDTLKRIPCKLFKRGHGRCPFRQHCLYEHRYGNGRLADSRQTPNAIQQMMVMADRLMAALPDRTISRTRALRAVMAAFASAREEQSAEDSTTTDTTRTSTTASEASAPEQRQTTRQGGFRRGFLL